MQSGKAQLGLRLDPSNQCRMQGASRLDCIFEEPRLSDTGFASHNQTATKPVRGPFDEKIDNSPLFLAPDQTGLTATAGTSLIRWRRHAWKRGTIEVSVSSQLL